MGKTTTILLILSSVMIIFHFGGLIQDTPISFLLNLLINPATIINSGFMNIVNQAFALFLTGGVVIGLFVSQKTELAVKASIASSLIIMGWDFIVLFNKLSEVNVFLATIIVGPMLLLFVLSVVSWWGGHD